MPTKEPISLISTIKTITITKPIITASRRSYLKEKLSTYKVGHYIDKGIDPRRLLLHITFTDKTKITLPFGQVTSTENFFDRYERYFDRKIFEVGPGFDEEWFSNAENYRQIIQRFPGLHDKTMDADFELYLRDFLFLIVPGDTLYQTGAVKDGVREYQFQLKNPKSGKMQSYFIYGNEGKLHYGIGKRPLLLLIKILLTKKESRNFSMTTKLESMEIIGMASTIYNSLT